MNVALGILALLIGDVALPGMDLPETPAWQPPSRLASPSSGYASGLSQPPPPSAFSYQRPAVVEPQIPYAPTDPNAGSAVYPYGSPTSQFDSSAGVRSPLLDYPSLWRTPTTPPGGPQRRTLPPLQPFGSSPLGGPLTPQDFSSYSPYAGQPDAGRATEYGHAAAIHGGGAFQSSTTRKPYSGYQPSRGVSPYMNLFRDDNDFGRIDNYSTLVQPRLDQIRSNRQSAGDIRGLQNSSQVQGSTIQRIGTRTGVVPRSTGDYFNNTGKFFGGPGR